MDRRGQGAARKPKGSYWVVMQDATGKAWSIKHNKFVSINSADKFSAAEDADALLATLHIEGISAYPVATYR